MTANRSTGNDNSMTRPTLLVLAAGLGSRYGGFKQIDPVGPNGEILLDYAVYDAWRAGFGRVVFVINAELESSFREHFGPRVSTKIDVAFAHQRLDDLPAGFDLAPERRKPWGTGHAIRAARHVIAEPFAAINADDFYGRSSYQALADFLGHAGQGSPLPFAMVAFRLANTLSKHGSVARGVCTVGSASLLANVVERTRIEACPDGGARFLDDAGAWQPLDDDVPVSMNIWGFTPGIFPALETEFAEFLRAKAQDPKAEFFIPSVVDALIKRGVCRTTVLHSDEHWFGMTYREDRAEVSGRIAELTAAGIYPAPLWSTL